VTAATEGLDEEDDEVPDCWVPGYPERHQQGQVELTNVDHIRAICDLADADFGVQIAEDGRVWICVDGVALIRFKPHRRPHLPVLKQ